VGFRKPGEDKEDEDPGDSEEGDDQKADVPGFRMDGAPEDCVTLV
jgi:hypothetical protein